LASRRHKRGIDEIPRACRLCVISFIDESTWTIPNQRRQFAARQGNGKRREEFRAAGNGGGLLTADHVTVHNIPKVRDLITMSKLLAFMGASVSIAEIPASDYTISAPTLNHAEAPYELVKTMRASILTLGPLMARLGIAHVSLPGGCAIGARPIDLHLAALEKNGRRNHDSHGYIEAKVPNRGRLKGAHISFDKLPSPAPKIF